MLLVLPVLLFVLLLSLIVGVNANLLLRGDVGVDDLGRILNEIHGLADPIGEIFTGFIHKL